MRLIKKYTYYMIEIEYPLIPLIPLSGKKNKKVILGFAKMICQEGLKKISIWTGRLREWRSMCMSPTLLLPKRRRRTSSQLLQPSPFQCWKSSHVGYPAKATPGLTGGIRDRRCCLGDTCPPSSSLVAKVTFHLQTGQASLGEKLKWWVSQGTLLGLW